MTIKTKFRLTPSGRGEASDIESWDMTKLANYIHTETLRQSPSSEQMYLNNALSLLLNISLEDDKKNTLLLNQKLFRPFLQDEVTFVFGKVLDIKYYRKDVAHIICEYMNEHGTYTGCFIAPIAQIPNLEPLHIDGYITILIGTCIRKTYKVSAKKCYNSRSHCAYQTKPREDILRNKLLVSHIFQLQTLSKQ